MTSAPMAVSTVVFFMMRSLATRAMERFGVLPCGWNHPLDNVYPKHFLAAKVGQLRTESVSEAERTRKLWQQRAGTAGLFRPPCLVIRLCGLGLGAPDDAAGRAIGLRRTGQVSMVRL